MSFLTNLIPNPSTNDTFVPRPASTLLTNFATFPSGASPAIGAGSTTNHAADDITRALRSSTAKVDLGAYMYNPPAVSTRVRPTPTLFVDTVNGNNANTGLSLAQAWKTFGFAVSNAAVVPGSVVGVADGTYNEHVVITKGGSAGGGYVIYMSINIGGAIIKGDVLNSSVIVPAANYIQLDGFEITAIANMTQHGVDLSNSALIGAHHQRVYACHIHDLGFSGISGGWGDYYDFWLNTVHNCTTLNTFQGSGISLYQLQAVDNAAGFHNFIHSNISYSNLLSPAVLPGGHTDSNGIIIDDFWNDQASGHQNNTLYGQATLVENNLMVNNGGKAFELVWSQFVTTRNNTAWKNNTDAQNPGTFRSEYNNQGQTAQPANNNAFYNNIAVCDSSVNINNDCYA